MTSAGFSLDERPSCTNCGYVYDPGLGDPAREVPAGIAFGRLPAHWRCPGCGGPQHGFFAGTLGADSMAERVAALVAAYRIVADTDMKGLAVCNPALEVEAVDFRDMGDAWLGALIAPWTLNAVLIPHDPNRWAALGDGDQMVEAMPTGQYAFKAARVGTLAVIAAVSDMKLLRDQDDARDAARAALDALQAPRPAIESQGDPVSRRSLFRGGRK